MGYIGAHSRAKYTGHTANDEQALLLMPDDYQRDQTKRGIVFLHGADGSYKQGGSGSAATAYSTVFRTVLNQLRLPILSVDAGSDGSLLVSQGAGTYITGSPNHMGNPTSLTAMTNMNTWATTASALANPYLDVVPGFKATGGLILMGYSMGGVLAHNWAARNPTLVKAIVSIAAPMNLDDVYTSGRGTYTGAIDIAYNGPRPNVAPTVTGTAGATNYIYRIVPVTNAGDGTAINSNTFAGVAVGSLGATPNTITWAFATMNTTSLNLGHKIVRTTDAGATWATVDTIGSCVLRTGSGTIATTTLNVEPLTYAIPNGTTLTLVDHDWTLTQTVTLTAGASIGNNTLTVSSFTPTRAYTIGSRVLPTKYVDSITGAGTALTPVTAPWTTNGKNASPSLNPSSYFPAALQAIPHQMWWSSNDQIVDPAGTVGTPTPNVAAYKAAYGANCTLQELAGAPAHGLAFSGFTSATVSTLLAFLAANA